MTRKPIAALTLALAWLGLACGGDGSTLRRGDEALARGDMDEALAEYGLAVRQNAEDLDARLRLAHASAVFGDVDGAVDGYEAVLALDSAWSDQAVADLLHLAKDAAARADPFDLARAAEAALRIEPSVGVGELALPLGEFYYAEGRWGEALTFLSRALRAVPADSAGGLLYDVARSYARLGDCERAVPLFIDYAAQVEPRYRGPRGDVEWQIGSCSLELARRFLAEELYDEGLEAVDRAIVLGEPRTGLSELWFLRGEILAGLARCDEAEAAFRNVESVSPTGVGAYVEEARTRADLIRFGGRRGGGRGGVRGCL